MTETNRRFSDSPNGKHSRHRPERIEHVMKLRSFYQGQRGQHHAEGVREAAQRECRIGRLAKD